MADFRRFFVEKIEKQVILSGEEFVHAVSVLRIKEGERIILLDNTDYEYTATVTAIDKKSLTAEVIDKIKSDKESKNRILLICGFLKGDKTELVVQKAAELGVLEIIVFESEHSSAYLSDKKVERLCKVAREAAKQCGRSRAPLVTAAVDFADALKKGEGYKNKLFACEFAEKSDMDLKSLSGDTAIVIGSEGGFTKGEFDLARDTGYSGITLGKRILRAETAAIAVCSVIAFLNGDLSR